MPTLASKMVEVDGKQIDVRLLFVILVGSEFELLLLMFHHFSKSNLL